MLVLFLLSSCSTKTNGRPSFLIIAVDRLGSNSISCSEYIEKGEGGFYQLCDDFIQFTNAYTPSVQSPAALASIFTGQYPFEHGLRHPEASLSFEKKSFPLLLWENSYKTRFFSGGDPVTSYQGLDRGFENFYDFTEVKPEESVSSLFRSALNFILEDENPKFTVIYLPQLRYLEDYNKNLSKIESELGKFFVKLKKSKKWHNTFISVVGLQGDMRQSHKSPWPVLDLDEKNIKVEAFVKPSTKPRDKELSFQIDQNISLADIGLTLYDFFFLAKEKDSYLYSAEREKKALFINNKKKQNIFSEQSLVNQLKNVSKKVKTSQKPILVETAWPDWRYGYSPIYLLIDDQYRVYLNKNLKIFNTLVNKDVTQFSDDQVPEERWFSYIRMSAEMNSDGRDQFKPEDISKLALGYEIWGIEKLSYKEAKDQIYELVENTKDKTELFGWLAKLSVNNKDCKALLDIAKKTKNIKWKLAARSCLNLKTKFVPPYRKGCLRVYFNKIKTWSNSCQNDLLYYSWKYIYFDKSLSLQKTLISLLEQKESKRKKMKQNWQTYLSSALVYESSLEPSDYDLFYLQLPEEKKKMLDELIIKADAP